MLYGSNTRPVRIRTEYDLLPRQTYGYVDGVSISGMPVVNGWRHYHWMLDQINKPLHKGDRRPPGICQHLKVDVEFNQDVFSYYDYDSSPPVLVSYVGWVDLVFDNEGQSPTGDSPATRPNDHGYSNMVGSFVDTPTYRNLCLSAFTKQISQVPAKISLLNFLFELKDFKELGKSLSKIPSLLKNQSLARHVNLVSKHKKSLPLVAAKAGTDTFLSWNFQWAPFIGDLQTLTKVGENAYKRLDWLRKTNQKSTTIHFQKEDCYTHPLVGTDVFVAGTSTNPHRYRLRSYQCDFVSTWRLYHNLRDINDALSGLKAVFATLGLNNPAKAVWNAIPFSFLLDWVGPFGTWLEKAAAQPFTGEWEISEVTSSVHEVYYIDFYSDYFPGGGHPNTSTLMQSVKVDRYSRLDGLPFTLGAFDFSQLTDTQQKLAAAIPLGIVLGKFH